MMHVFCDLLKVAPREDGMIEVEGIAQAQCTDSDGETITADAMREALPDFLKFGAVREMHGLKAAGTVLEASVGADDRTYIKALVVDRDAVRKVQTGVYKGFSIGGKALARDPEDSTIITKLRWIECSLVDRPNNPEAVLTMWKADQIDDPAGATQETSDMTKADADTTAAAQQAAAPAGAADQIEKREFIERKADAKAGHALPDGSFPIETEADLKNAVAAYGRAKNKPAAKAHIKRRAAALNCTHCLPDKWRTAAQKAAAATTLAKAEEDLLAKTAEAHALATQIAEIEPDEEDTAVTKTETTAEAGTATSEAAKVEGSAATSASTAAPAPAATTAPADPAPAEVAPSEKAEKAETATKADEPKDPLAKAEAALARLEAVTRAGDVAKGMYTVGSLAQMLQSVSYMVREVKAEADMEGDNSPLPAMLRDWLKQGANILRAMSKEELDELVAAADKTVAGTEAGLVAQAYKASKASDLTKAEGTTTEGAETLTRADVTDLIKAEVAPIAAERDTLKTQLADRDSAIEKMAGRIETAAEAISKLSKRLEEIESKPVRKTAASGFVAVSKAADSAGAGTTEQPEAPSRDDIAKALAAMSNEERAEFEMRVALNKGRVIPLAAG